MDDVVRKVIIRKKDRIDYILSGVADYYNTTISDIKGRRRNERLMNRKRLAMVLLYDIADCSLKDIISAMNYNIDGYANVFNHIKDTREDMASPTTEGKALKSEYNSILRHLNL